jgi:hypothetical protein
MSPGFRENIVIRVIFPAGPRSTQPTSHPIKNNPPLFRTPPGKSGPRIRVLFAFLSKNHPWQGTGKEAAGPPLRAILRGAFQPIFGKISILQAIFPREVNPGPICCPSGGLKIPGTETEPCTGVFGHGGMGRGEGLDLEFRVPEVAGCLTCDGTMTRDRSGTPTG